MKWTTKDGNTKDIRELETSHLENILKMLIKNNGEQYFLGGFDGDGMPYGDAVVIDNNAKIEAIELELRLRKIEVAISTKESL